MGILSDFRFIVRRKDRGDMQNEIWAQDDRLRIWGKGCGPISEEDERKAREIMQVRTNQYTSDAFSHTHRNMSVHNAQRGREWGDACSECLTCVSVRCSCKNRIFAPMLS